MTYGKRKNPESDRENETHKILWDFGIQTDRPGQSQNADLILISN